MSEPGRRVAHWMSALCDVLQKPLIAMPTQFIFDRLEETFRFSMVSHNWREADGRIGIEIRPVATFLAHADLYTELVEGQWLDHHPLIGWYATTRNPRPWTSARVPTSVVPARRRAHVDGALRRVDAEQQLSMNYRLAGPTHRAYVLARTGGDFDDEDLVVASYVMRALRALDFQVELLRRRQPGADLAAAVEVGLTGREIAVLQLLADGHSNRLIGARLSCSPRTVEKHLERIYRKLEVSDRLNAVRIAQALSLVAGPSPPRTPNAATEVLRLRPAHLR